MPERGCAIVVLSNGTDSVDPALTWPVMRAMARIYPLQPSSHESGE
jgi:hypothetical protein